MFQYGTLVIMMKDFMMWKNFNLILLLYMFLNKISHKPISNPDVIKKNILLSLLSIIVQ